MNKSTLKTLKIIGIVILTIVILWFILVLVNFNNVKQNKKPILCFNNTREVEDDDEYNMTCKGILYKYREYYRNSDNVLTGKEFTLFFRDFTREI